MPHDGHDRPVFRARSVVEAERIPSNDVGIFNGAIGLGPNGQAVVGSFAVRGVYAGGEAFIDAIRRHPQLVRGESSDLLWAVIRIQ